MTYLTIRIPETPRYTPRPWVIKKIPEQERDGTGVPLELPLPLDDDEGRTEIIPDRNPEKSMPDKGYVIIPDDDTVETTVNTIRCLGIETFL